MTHPTPSSVKWYTDQLNKFRGWTVAGTLKDDDGFFALILSGSPETGERVAVWFYSDDEGNSPGSFEIQEL